MEDKLVNLMKKYPYIPFNVDDGGRSSYQVYYRWNEESNTIEHTKASIGGLGRWEQGRLKLKGFVGAKNHYCFIVFKEALTSYLYRGSKELEVIINNKHHELIAR